MDYVAEVIDRVSTWGAWLSGIGIAFLAVGTVADIAARKLLSHGIPSTIALTEAMLVLIVALGLSQAELDKSHIRTSLITQLLPVGVQRVISRVIWVVITLFLIWMTYRTGSSAADSFVRGESSLLNQAIPLWPPRAAISIGIGVLALQAALNALFRRDAPANSRHDTSDGATS